MTAKRTIEISGITFTEGEEVFIAKSLYCGGPYTAHLAVGPTFYVGGYTFSPHAKAQEGFIVVAGVSGAEHGWWLDVRDPDGVQIVFPAFEPVTDKEVAELFGLDDARG